MINLYSLRKKKFDFKTEKTIFPMITWRYSMYFRRYYTYSHRNIIAAFIPAIVQIINGLDKASQQFFAF